MIRRIIAIVLIVLGLGTIGAAIASATVWKPDSIVTVPLPSEPTVNYVVTDPGVLNIVNPTVKVRAVAQDDESPVFLAMGRTDDVEAWVEASDHGKITGLETWEELLYQTVDAVEPEDDGEEGDAQEEEEPEPANPADSDMWVEEVNGVGELSYTWEEIPGRWSMLVATDGASPAPMVELTWEREVPTPALIPGIILGAVLALSGALLLFIALRPRTEVTEEAVVDEPQMIDATGLEYAADVDPADVDDGSDLAELEGEVSPEEIMASVEAAAQKPEPVADTGEFEYSLSTPKEADEPYPHALGEEEVAEEERPLTRREIRERERQLERAAALEGDGRVDAEEREQWPTQEPLKATAVGEAGDGKPRRWWQRSQASVPAAGRGPIVIDDATGEIVITGEIDVSSLNPQASGDSWRATWGLDKDTPTRWVPIVTPSEENDGEADE